LFKKQFPRLGEIVLHCESQGWSSYMSEPRDKFALACAISIAVAAFSTDGLAAQAPVTHGNKSWTDRFGESREFAAFLEDWIAERIDPLDVEQVDSMDCEYLIDQRSNELIALALERGFYADIVAVAQPHGGVNSYIRYLYQSDPGPTK
jgi:hypothetical protein